VQNDMLFVLLATAILSAGLRAPGIAPPAAGWGPPDDEPILGTGHDGSAAPRRQTDRKTTTP
jgi:hypothetical protein